MNETTSQKPEESIPEAVVVRRRGLSPVWLVPIIAAGVAASLLYTTFERRGKTVEISFSEASGVDAGKTRVRYRDVFIGTVSEVRLSDDFTHTVIEAQINENGERLLVEGTRFWVERPRIGPQGISGLTTLVSGAYIALDPGTLGGVLKRKYQGLSDPPQMLKGDKGLHLNLNSPSGSGGLTQMSPVLHEGIQVGRITGLDLAKEAPGVNIRISVDAKYADRVHANTHFWNASGIDAHAGFSGIDVEIASLETVLSGAIEFATLGSGGRPVETGHSYQVFKNRQDAFHRYQESLGLQIFVRTDQLGSIANGDGVLYRGVKVGKVLGHELEDNAQHILLRLQVDARYAPLVRTNSVFWNASGISSDLGLTGLHVHTSSLESMLQGAISFATPTLLARGQRLRANLTWRVRARKGGSDGPPISRLRGVLKNNSRCEPSAGSAAVGTE